MKPSIWKEYLKEIEMVGPSMKEKERDRYIKMGICPQIQGKEEEWIEGSLNVRIKNTFEETGFKNEIKGIYAEGCKRDHWRFYDFQPTIH